MTSSVDERVIALAPTGRDGHLIQSGLARAGIVVTLCANVDDLCLHIRDGVGVVFIAEEALTVTGIARLGDALRRQPAWSDVPLIVSTGAGETTDARIRMLNALQATATVAILERPVRMLTMVATVKAALITRRRQYEKRDLIERIAYERERLQVAIEALEQARNEAQAAKIAAEAANRAKDEFLAMLGHELRNPLSPILTALEIMRLKGEDALGRERAIIERQARHMAHLVDDVLDVSRITRGMIELKRERAQVADLIAKALETAAPLLERAQHELITRVPQGLWIDADPARMVQVLSNLLTNAAKYTPDHGRIIVSATQEGDDVILAVTDTGRGILADMLPRIFEPFLQARQSSDRALGGLGLGLAIVKSLVELHGGSVTVSSAGAGQGSEFRVRLRAAPVRAAETLLPLRRGILTPLAANERRICILVVDDNAEAADALNELLHAFGYRTYVAYDGPAALAFSDVPDVAVLDIGLPVMDGYELARRLRQRQEWGQVTLVALTGYGLESDRQRAMAAGFDHHLVKPVDLAALEAILSERRRASMLKN